MTRQNFWRPLFAACLPARCISCGHWVPTPHGAWCPACYAALPRCDSSCSRCAAPLPSTATTLCGACLHRPPPFAATLAACRYTFPLDRLLQDFKYSHRLALAAPLAQLLVDACREAANRSPAVFPEPPTHVLAMPLSATRQCERGFNQAQELARHVALALKLPLLTDVLRRHKDAPKQATLPWRQRHKNVRGAFACRHDLAGHHLLLIDDVMTTGATAAAAAKTLCDAGAANVFIGVVARASAASEVSVP